ncbi:hypothetical protein [Candidatus Rhabdochlamydia sp. T3358]|uniref:hypothetical protein n=1 Tax=Candidatus Rhabdochlamydia sp. T3358 TaxID=2099795 RepID=UPI0010B3D240|nr:hypothetical protein [Candidatus Rhabdochlamydia sp. T3358]VHO03471.1 hypothetical protein RHT_00924 [Candidatus Rhabdochlamydia sp. T3358]
MNQRKRTGEFSQKTINALAKRAAYTCSNCQISTLCAAESSDSEHAHTGQAAHIIAAARNGPRASESATTDEKASISNGIYLCQICAKLIDANGGKDYSPEKLKKMKQDHEKSTREKIVPLPGENLKIQSSVNVLDNSESWENLIQCFSSECAQRIVNDITDPRMQAHMKDFNGPGKKKWLNEKFKKIPMNMGDPRAITFIAAKKECFRSYRWPD